MPKVSTYTRKRIQSLHEQTLHAIEIFKMLKGEDLAVSYQCVTRIINKLKLTSSTDNMARSGWPRKVSPEAKAFIEEQMRRNDKTTSCEIQKKLAKNGLVVHASTVRRSRKEQGWTLQQTRYCQLIREANKVKRLEFAQRILDSGDTFNNVIFLDECSISLQQFRRICYWKVDEPAKRKPKPKHPLKVHVWAGISRSGATKICIFEGIMRADLYCNILEDALILFINETLPNHRFMQDNDPKHTKMGPGLFRQARHQLVADSSWKPRPQSNWERLAWTKVVPWVKSKATN